MLFLQKGNEIQSVRTHNKWTQNYIHMFVFLLTSVVVGEHYYLLLNIDNSYSNISAWA